MESIFGLFSQSGEASPTLMALSLLEPLLIFIAFIYLVVVSIKHYSKTKSLGALLISISLLGSVIISVITEFLANEATSSADVQIVLIGNIISGILFLTIAYGFKLICKQAQE